jgi:putative ABC transport system permease protein
VAIGIATLIFILAMMSGMNKSVTDQIAQLGANTFYVTNRPFVIRGDWWKYRNRPNVTTADVAALRRAGTVLDGIAPMAFSQADVGYRGESMTQVDVRGTTDEYIDTSTMKVDAGRFLSPIDVELNEPVAVIGADVRTRLFRQADPIGAKITIGDQRYRVVGTLKVQGNMFGRSQDAVAIIPLGRFREQFGKKRSLTIAVTAPPDKLNEAEDQIIETLRRSRGLEADKDDTFAINRQSEIVRIFHEETAMLAMVAGLVGLITLLVGGIGVMNIMLVSVTERTREVGVRRALGARRFTILMQFLSESVLVTMIGGALGTILGLAAAKAVGDLTGMETLADPRVAVSGMIFSAIVGALAGVWPAFRAAWLDPIESLRYE